MEYSFQQLENQIESDRDDQSIEPQPEAEQDIDQGEKNWELKELQPKHELVLLMYLEGIDRDTISTTVKLSKWWLSRIIHSKVGQAYMQAKINELDTDFKALYYKAVAAIREGLDNEDIEVRLKAAEKYLKAHGYYERKDPGRDTAEDVVKRVLELKVTETKPLIKESENDNRN